MTDTLIILAGGASSRMKQSEDSSLSKEMVAQANVRSKALILLNDRPMLDYLLYNAKRAGIKHVIIVISPQGALFKEYYGTKDAGNTFHGLTISYAVQQIPNDREKPLGTADAVLQTLEQYPDLQQRRFLVCNSDNLYSAKAMALLINSKTANAFINYDRDALEYPMERVSRFALTKVDQHNFLEGIIEKPDPLSIETYKGEDGSFRVSMNNFKFDGAQFFRYLKKCPIHEQRNEKELPSAILLMVNDAHNAMKAISMAEHVPDLTGKHDIKVMNDYLSKHIPSLDWST